MCGGVQGCRHGEYSTKTKLGDGCEGIRACETRRTRRSFAEANREAPNRNAQNAQHTQHATKTNAEAGGNCDSLLKNGRIVQTDSSMALGTLENPHGVSKPAGDGLRRAHYKIHGQRWLAPPSDNRGGSNSRWKATASSSLPRRGAASRGVPLRDRYNHDGSYPRRGLVHLYSTGDNLPHAFATDATVHVARRPRRFAARGPLFLYRHV